MNVRKSDFNVEVIKIQNFSLRNGELRKKLLSWGLLKKTLETEGLLYPFSKKSKFRKSYFRKCEFFLAYAYMCTHALACGDSFLSFRPSDHISVQNGHLLINPPIQEHLSF